MWFYSGRHRHCLSPTHVTDQGPLKLRTKWAEFPRQAHPLLKANAVEGCDTEKPHACAAEGVWKKTTSAQGTSKRSKMVACF